MGLSPIVVCDCVCGADRSRCPTVFAVAGRCHIVHAGKSLTDPVSGQGVCVPFKGVAIPPSPSPPPACLRSINKKVKGREMKILSQKEKENVKPERPWANRAAPRHPLGHDGGPSPPAAELLIPAGIPCPPTDSGPIAPVAGWHAPRVGRDKPAVPHPG
jgi:hypothetical protein